MLSNINLKDAFSPSGSSKLSIILTCLNNLQTMELVAEALFLYAEIIFVKILFLNPGKNSIFLLKGLY